MSQKLTDENCFLCGHPARSGSYNRNIGKAFIDCKNKECGEYLIQHGAIKELISDVKKRQELSKSATSREEIKASEEILTIRYYGGIKAEFKRLENVMSPSDISFFGFK